MKRVLIAVILTGLVLLVLPSTGQAYGPIIEVSIVRGDVDCDDDIDAVDALRLLQWSGTVGDCWRAGIPAQIDLDCSGAVDAADALIILEYVSGVRYRSTSCPGPGWVLAFLPA